MHLFDQGLPIIVEMSFDLDYLCSLKDNIDLLFKLFSNGYNLLEPEHSTKNPILSIDFVAP